jgi:hypothetical protein
MFILITEYTMSNGHKEELAEPFTTRAQLMEAANEYEPDEIVRAAELHNDGTWTDLTAAAQIREPEGDPYASERLDAFTQGCGRYAL